MLLKLPTLETEKKQKKNSFANEASAQHPNASVDSNPHQVFTNGESSRRHKCKKLVSRFEGIGLYTNLSTGMSILNVSNMPVSVCSYCNVCLT